MYGKLYLSTKFWHQDERVIFRKTLCLRTGQSLDLNLTLPLKLIGFPIWKVLIVNSLSNSPLWNAITSASIPNTLRILDQVRMIDLWMNCTQIYCHTRTTFYRTLPCSNVCTTLLRPSVPFPMRPSGLILTVLLFAELSAENCLPKNTGDVHW